MGDLNLHETSLLSLIRLFHGYKSSGLSATSFDKGGRVIYAHKVVFLPTENVLKICFNMHNMTSPLKQGQGQPEDL